MIIRLIIQRRLSPSETTALAVAHQRVGDKVVTDPYCLPATLGTAMKWAELWTMDAELVNSIQFGAYGQVINNLID